MYNELQKNDYLKAIEDRNNSTVNLRPMFEKAAEAEEKLGKDLCDFSTKDIMSLYGMFFSTSYYYLNNVNSQFKIYTAWCLSNNLVRDGFNHYREMNKEMILQCVNKGLKNAKIITREKLIESMKDSKNPRDRFMFLGIFEGINDQFLKSLRTCTMKNFDLDKKEFTRLDGVKIPVSDELISYAITSAEEMEYYAYKNDKVSLFKEADEQYILKGNYNSKEEWCGYGTYKHVKEWYIEEYGYYFLDANSLKESGKIDMTRRLMKKDGTDAITTIKNHPEIMEIYNSFIIEDFCDIYKEYLED